MLGCQAHPPERAPLGTSKALILNFIQDNDYWVIEGFYTDLLALVSDQAEEIIFMNLEVSMCIKNARSRPWEPHKYESKEAQDANLTMLIQWIENYALRSDEFSFVAHSQFYEQFEGSKRMLTENNSMQQGGPGD